MGTAGIDWCICLSGCAALSFYINYFVSFTKPVDVIVLNTSCYKPDLSLEEIKTATSDSEGRRLSCCLMQCFSSILFSYLCFRCPYSEGSAEGNNAERSPAWPRKNVRGTSEFSHDSHAGSFLNSRPQQEGDGMARLLLTLYRLQPSTQNGTARNNEMFWNYHLLNRNGIITGNEIKLLGINLKSYFSFMQKYFRWGPPQYL